MNGVEEVSHRRTDFLSSRSTKERKVYFDSTFGDMCINCMRYFQLTLNHSIRTGLSEFTISNENVWIWILSGSLFSVSVGLIETNFTEYSKSDFIVWATSLY